MWEQTATDTWNWADLLYHLAPEAFPEKEALIF